MKKFLIAVIGALGAMCRYGLGLAFGATLFPACTLTINISGAFLLAVIFGAVASSGRLPADFAAALGTGFVGAFTTFSALSVETVNMFSTGHPGLALIYIGASIAGGLVASLLGVKLSTAIIKKRRAKNRKARTAA